jgi:DNA-binding GntR family transcriptional regulator
MSIKDKLTQELDSMSEAELEQVAEYMAFLRFRARRRTTPLLDEAQLAALYAEFADEDRELAEEGMSDYAKGLLREDSR